MSGRVMGWVEGAGRIDQPVGTLARVGATPDNDIVVRVEGVSRTHARIVGEQDGYWVEDVNSRNGTWLNGERVKRARLRHLDVITLGKFAEFVFVEREGAEATAAPTNAQARVRIEWLDGERRGTVLDIPAGETLIGRAESCAIVVNTPAISRAHARISNSGGRVVIEDLGSANGTTVDGQLIKGPVTLATGSEVVLGEARRFRVSVDGVSAASTPTQLGATPTRSQDMEWATRLVFSAEDLEAISRAAGGIDQPSPPPMRPVGKAPTAPVVPVPSAAVPPATAQPTIKTTPPGPPSAQRAMPDPALANAQRAMPDPAPRGPAPADGTRVGGADLRVPTGIGNQVPPPEAGATQFGGPGPGAAPPFTPPKFSPPGAGSTVGGQPIADRTMFDGGAAPSARNNLPPAVGPPERQEQKRIVIAQLTGSMGSFALSAGTSTVGRSPDATLRIDSRELSRIHAAITVSDREITVEDRGSVNGTLVNGTRIAAPTRVSAGDRIAFANVEFRVDVKWTEGI